MKVLKKHLLGVFLCAAVYDVEATLKFLVQTNMLEGILAEIYGLTDAFKEEYERKMFIVGLARLCKVGH